MSRRAMVLLERHAGIEPGSRTIVASYSIRRFRGARRSEEIARVEVHADGTVYSRRDDGELERQAFGDLEHQRADALLWLAAKLVPED